MSHEIEVRAAYDGGLEEGMRLKQAEMDHLSAECSALIDIDRAKGRKIESLNKQLVKATGRELVLRAHVERLLEALRQAHIGFGCCYKKTGGNYEPAFHYMREVTEALEESPSTSLSAIKKAERERCIEAIREKQGSIIWFTDATDVLEAMKDEGVA